MKRLALSVALSLVTLPALMLSGCSANFGTVTAESDTAQIPIGSIKGSAHGGQQPIVGEDVYLFAVGASTNGPSVSLLSGTGHMDTFGRSYVVTDSNGDFNITGDYTCTYSPTAPQVLYLYGINGDPGGGTNTSAGLMAVLGACPSTGTFAGQVSFVFMNEVSTVAAAYSLAGYAADATDISVRGPGGTTNPPTLLADQGLVNAAANANQLYQIDGDGSNINAANTQTPGSTSKNTGTVPAAMINSIANSLAACINSAPPNTPCTMLFNDLPVGPSGATPTDTATAAIYIAKHPTTNVYQIFALGGDNPVFTPTLASAPYDFTVAISYTAKNLLYPQDIAVDAVGNVWVTSPQANAMIELSSTGIAQSYTQINPDSIAIDTAGNGTSSVAPGDVFTNGPYAYTSGAVANPKCEGVDDTGTADCIYEINSSGTAGTPTYLKAATYALLGSTDIISDGTNNYIADPTNDKLVTTTETDPQTGVIANTKMYADDGGAWTYLAVTAQGGYILATAPSTGYICRTDAATNTACTAKNTVQVNAPQRIAIDSASNAWIPDSTQNALYQVIDTNASKISSNEYSGGGLNTPFGIAIDGAGTAWVTNQGQITFGDGSSCTGCSISAFSTSTGSTGNAITPATVGTSGSTYYNPSGGYTSGNETVSQGYYNLAIDGSGDIWIVNSNEDTVTEIIGVAAPTVTPLSYAVANGQLGAKP